MPETDVIPTSASIASTGKGIRYVGNWAYANSGEVNVTNVTTTLLDFTSGTGVIRGKIQFNMLAQTADDFLYYVYFNDTIIQGYFVLEAYRRGKPDTPLEIIIPPLTHVKLTAQNESSTSSYKQIVTLVGRVYGAK